MMALNIVLLVFFACCSICLAQTGTFMGTNIRENKGQLKQGETLEFSCSIKEPRSNYFIQIFKHELVSVFPPGKSTADYELDDKEYLAICNNTSLDPVYQKIGRYSCNNLVKRDDYTKITLTITDIQPKDSGVFACRVYYTEEGFPSPLLSLRKINVTGPIRNVELNSPAEIPSHFTSVIGGTIPDLSTDQSPLEVVLSGKPITIGCEVTLGSSPKWPIVQAFLDNEEITGIQSAKGGDIEGNILSGYLFDSYVHTYFYWEMTLSVKDDKKNLTCIARQQEDWTEPMSTSRLLDVKGPPEAPNCDQQYIGAPIGTLDVPISCSVLVYETSEVDVTVYGPEPMDLTVTSADPNSDITIQRDGTSVFTTFTLKNVTEHGLYQFVWKNQYGRTGAAVEIGNKVSSAVPRKTGVYLILVIIFIMVAF